MSFKLEKKNLTPNFGGEILSKMVDRLLGMILLKRIIITLDVRWEPFNVIQAFNLWC